MLVRFFRPLFKKSPKVQVYLKSNMFLLILFNFSFFWVPFYNILDDDGAGNDLGFKPQINLQVPFVFGCFLYILIHIAREHIITPCFKKKKHTL